MTNEWLTPQRMGQWFKGVAFESMARSGLSFTADAIDSLDSLIADGVKGIDLGGDDELLLANLEAAEFELREFVREMASDTISREGREVDLQTFSAAIRRFCPKWPWCP